jgi:hypothetical protein
MKRRGAWHVKESLGGWFLISHRNKMAVARAVACDVPELRSGAAAFAWNVSETILTSNCHVVMLDTKKTSSPLPHPEQKHDKM